MRVNFHINCVVVCFALERSPISPLNKLRLETKHLQAQNNSYLRDISNGILNTRINFAVFLREAELEMDFEDIGNLKKEHLCNTSGDLFCPHRIC